MFGARGRMVSKGGQTNQGGREAIEDFEGELVGNQTIGEGDGLVADARVADEEFLDGEQEGGGEGGGEDAFEPGGVGSGRVDDVGDDGKGDPGTGDDEEELEPGTGGEVELDLALGRIPGHAPSEGE